MDLIIERWGLNLTRTRSYWIAYRGMMAARGATLQEAVIDCVMKLIENNEQPEMT
jgi:hypothetical protein